MREIKFRAWTAQYKGMIYGIENYSIEHNSTSGHCGDVMDLGEYIKYYPVMQYTGLKDKNGVEIYEGDIVQRPYIDPMGRVTNTPEDRKVVEFDNGCFGIRGKGNFQTMQYYLEHKDGEYIPNYGNATIYGPCILKVIGNIYENPELLEG